jgi:arylsulfatase A-like enzyme
VGEIVGAAGRTNTFLGERYRRLARRRGKQRAIVAVGNAVLTIVYHLLADPQARYHDLGADFYQAHRNQQRYQPNLIRQLEQLTGRTVTLTPRPERPAA